MPRDPVIAKILWRIERDSRRHTRLVLPANAVVTPVVMVPKQAGEQSASRPHLVGLPFPAKWTRTPNIAPAHRMR
jgi:hypothetical protein